jgi:hypothetical protein
VFHVTQNGHTHVVFLKVEDHAQETAGELQQLHGHSVFHAVHLGHAVAHGQDRPGLGNLDLLVVVLDLRLYNFTDFFCSDFHMPLPLDQRFFEVL